MDISIILPVNALPGHCVIDTSGQPGRLKTLSIVGLVTTEIVSVQIPKVENPADGNDAHWTPLVQDGLAVELSSSNNVIFVPAILTLRLVKPAGVDENAYGVRWS